MAKKQALILNWDAGAILARMAVTALEPKHEHALSNFGSCYGRVAQAMRRGYLRDDDMIVMVGYGANVHHVFTERAGKQVIDTFAEGSVYDPSRGLYHNPDIPASQLGRAFSTVTKLTYSEFKRLFSPDKLDVANDATFPPCVETL